MIYGANGFTGRLIAREARRGGLAPVLAGRSAAVHALGADLGLESRVFDLETPAGVARNLEDVALVLHCAGPFARTARPMLAGCLATGTHYLDITGEHAVLEHLHGQGAGAARAGVVAVGGVGFDVVPTDGVAVHLARALPSATRLRLAVLVGTPSRGTATTLVEGLGAGGLSRQGGLLVREPVALRTWPVEHGGAAYRAVSLPWGDLVTAYFSTGIPTVETYLAVSAPAARLLRGADRLTPLLRRPAVQRLLRRWAGRARGPGETQMRQGRTVVWGEVTDPSGRRRAARLLGPEAYRFTAQSALAAARRVLTGGVPAGAWTPSQAFGPDFVTGLPGVELLPDPGGERV